MNRWLKREKLSADKPRLTGSRTREPVRLKAAVAANPNACLDELPESLDSKSSTVAYNLQKQGIARQKNTLYAERSPAACFSGI